MAKRSWRWTLPKLPPTCAVAIADAVGTGYSNISARSVTNTEAETRKARGKNCEQTCSIDVLLRGPGPTVYGLYA